MNVTSNPRKYWRYGRNLMTGALAAVAMMTLDAPQVQAVDGKTYPGSSCVRFGGSTPRLNASRLFNQGFTVLSLDCPVVHDSIDESIQDGYVDVIDANFGSSEDQRDVAVCANLLSVSQADNAEILTVQSTGRKCSTINGPVRKRLSFDGLPAHSDAHYFYSVSIPPKVVIDQRFESAIISYRVDEND